MRPITLAALLLACAMPAGAQQFDSGSCGPHGNGELRCGVPVQVRANQGQLTLQALLETRAVGGSTSFMAHLWASTCGVSGRRVASVAGVADGAASVAIGTVSLRFEGEIALSTMSGYCLEIFVTNCLRAGRAVSCVDALDGWNNRIILRRMG